MHCRIAGGEAPLLLPCYLVMPLALRPQLSYLPAPRPAQLPGNLAQHLRRRSHQVNRVLYLCSCAGRRQMSMFHQQVPLQIAPRGRAPVPWMAGLQTSPPQAASTSPIEHRYRASTCFFCLEVP